jgi:hypothetical protein
VIPDFLGGRVILIRELVPNYGRWLGHLMQENVTPLDLSSEQAVALLANALDDPPPPSAARPRRRWSSRRE